MTNSKEQSSEFLRKTQELDRAYEELENIVKKEVRKPVDEILLSLVSRIVELNVELEKEYVTE